MIISRSHANRLVREGKATKDGATYHDGQRYQIVIRHDLQRVDHYPLDQGQHAIVQVHNFRRETIESQDEVFNR